VGSIGARFVERKIVLGSFGTYRVSADERTTELPGRGAADAKHKDTFRRHFEYWVRLVFIVIRLPRDLLKRKIVFGSFGTHRVPAEAQTTELHGAQRM
jgi:hypothetical protein